MSTDSSWFINETLLFVAFVFQADGTTDFQADGRDWSSCARISLAWLLSLAQEMSNTGRVSDLGEDVAWRRNRV